MESSFAAPTEKQIQRGVHRSTRQLEAANGFGASPANVTGSLAGLWVVKMAADIPGGHWIVNDGKTDISGKALSLDHVFSNSEERLIAITLTHP